MISHCDLTKRSDITIVLSGNLSNNPLHFWRNFIELQSRLPIGKRVSQIVAHCWSPQLSELVEIVYAPNFVQNDNLDDFYLDALKCINLKKFFILQHHKTKLFLQDKCFRLILSNAYSRSCAIRLMDQLHIKSGQVLITSWNFESTDLINDERIIIDASLPDSYLYLNYDSNVDAGYPDKWILAPWYLASYFRELYQFTIDSISGKNDYLDYFAKRNWFITLKNRLKITRIPYFFRCELRMHTSKLLKKILDKYEGDLNGDNILRKILRRVIRPIYLFSTRPSATAENSSLSIYKKLQTDLSIDFALESKTLLRYFILLNGFRHKLRFLAKDDFEASGQLGQLINPQKIALIVFDDSELLLELLKQSPLPVVVVYQIKKESVVEHLFDENGGWASTNIKVSTASFKAKIYLALSAVEKSFNYFVPLLFFSNIIRYLECRDWVYLNALLKFIEWRGVEYVDLCSKLKRELSLEFPCLQNIRSNSFSLSPSVGSSNGIRKILEKTCSDGIDPLCFVGEIDCEFSAVSEGRLFMSFEYAGD